MPQVSAQHGGSDPVILTYEGTQYIDNGATLAFPTSGTTTIVLDPDLFTAPGDYVLFDYTEGFFPGGQSSLNANVTVDGSGLPAWVAVASLRDDTARRIIILTLRGTATPMPYGTQYVEANLNISTGPIFVYMNSAIYKGPGTYAIFDVTGTVTGSLSNLKIVPPAGLYASSITTAAGGLGTWVLVTLSY